MKTFTKRATLDKYYKGNIYTCGYNKLASLLVYEEPLYYISREGKGWGADVYLLTDDSILVTGCTPYGKEIPLDIIENFESAAKQVEKMFTDKNVKEGLFRNFMEILVKQIKMRE